MRTIAEKYIEEGREEGREEGIEATAINMLLQKADVKFISKVTGYTIEQIKMLKNKLQ